MTSSRDERYDLNVKKKKEEKSLKSLCVSPSKVGELWRWQ